MWFKQITFYPINAQMLPEIDALPEKLAQFECVPVMGLDSFSEGFAPPYGFSPELIFVADTTWSVALKKSEKVLPSTVVRDVLDERVAQIQNDEARAVGRKEKKELIIA